MERSVQVRTMSWSIDESLLPREPTRGKLMMNGPRLLVELPNGLGWVQAGELRGPQAKRLIALMEKGVEMHVWVRGKTILITWRS